MGKIFIWFLADSWMGRLTRLSGMDINSSRFIFDAQTCEWYWSFHLTLCQKVNKHIYLSVKLYICGCERKKWRGIAFYHPVMHGLKGSSFGLVFGCFWCSFSIFVESHCHNVESSICCMSYNTSEQQKAPKNLESRIFAELLFPRLKNVNCHTILVFSEKLQLTSVILKKRQKSNWCFFNFNLCESTHKYIPWIHFVAHNPIFRCFLCSSTLIT